MSFLNKKVKFGNIETTDISQVGGIGSTLALSTIYQAAYDGYVICTAITGSAGAYIQCDVGVSSPPTDMQLRTGSAYSQWGDYITCPVKKGEYWTCGMSGNHGAPIVLFRKAKL